MNIASSSSAEVTSSDSNATEIANLKAERDLVKKVLAQDEGNRPDFFANNPDCMLFKSYTTQELKDEEITLTLEISSLNAQILALMTSSSDKYPRIQISKPTNFTKKLINVTAPAISDRACHHLVDIDATLAKAMKIIGKESLEECLADGAHRIKPIVMSRLSRGGKTTVAIKLFDKLKLEGFCPIFISFNGNALFKHRVGESHEHAILRRIAVQFTNETDDFNFNVDRKTLLNYIAAESKEKSVVLIIDGLNVLSTTLDESATELLLSEFLDKKNRFLVIAAHIPMRLDNTVNDRGAHVIDMPLSVNLKDLRLMSNECGALTPFEAVFYGGIPSVIYSIKGGRFNPSERVSAQLSLCGRGDMTVESFLKLVLTGVRCDPRLFLLYAFGTAKEGSKMQFPLCYVNALLSIWFQQNCFGSLYDHLTTFGAKLESGLDWETLIQYAVMMRCVLACKDSAERGPFDIVPAGVCPDFIYKSVPGEHKTVDAVLNYVKGSIG